MTRPDEHARPNGEAEQGRATPPTGVSLAQGTDARQGHEAPLSPNVTRALDFYRDALAANARIVENAAELLKRHGLPLLTAGVLAAAACCCLMAYSPTPPANYADDSWR